MTFNRIVSAVQILAAGIALATVILLFTRQAPGTPGVGNRSATITAQLPAVSRGASLFADNCASCHGAQGQGGTAPQLIGSVATKYPNIDDQIAVVSNGKSLMPSFGASLTPEEIRQVVEFTRQSSTRSER